MFGCDAPLVQICLEPAVYQAVRVFGVAEYLSACAILLLVLSVSDFRYRFRLQIAPYGGQRAAFVAASFVGVLLIAAEFWFMQALPVPAWLNNLPAIQTTLGLVFVLVVLYCCWVVFVSPPTFGPANAERYVSAFYSFIGSGSREQMAVLASELGRSVKRIMDAAGQYTSKSRPNSPEAFAYNLLFIIGDKRFCRALVEAASWTIEEIFVDLRDRPNVNKLPLSTFAAAVGAELITNVNSPLPMEVRSTSRSYFGHFKPISISVFGNAALVADLSEPFGPLDLWAELRSDLTPEHYENYSAAALIFSRDYFEKPRSRWNEGRVLRQTLETLQMSNIDLHQVDGASEGVWYMPQIQKLKVAVKHATELMEIMDDAKVAPPKYYETDTAHDDIAKYIVELIKHAVQVKGPKSTAWLVHHNMIWGDLWTFRDSENIQAIAKKVRRLLYDEIKEMDRYPGFLGARILGYVLSIHGLSSRRYYQKQFEPLKASAISWARKNYWRLRLDYPDVAEAVLIGSITFDASSNELVKTYARGVTPEPTQERITIEVV